MKSIVRKAMTCIVCATLITGLCPVSALATDSEGASTLDTPANITSADLDEYTEYKTDESGEVLPESVADGASTSSTTVSLMTQKSIYVQASKPTVSVSTVGSLPNIIVYVTEPGKGVQKDSYYTSHWQRAKATKTDDGYVPVGSFESAPGEPGTGFAEPENTEGDTVEVNTVTYAFTSDEQSAFRSGEVYIYRVVVTSKDGVTNEAFPTDIVVVVGDYEKRLLIPKGEEQTYDPIYRFDEVTAYGESIHSTTKLLAEKASPASSNVGKLQDAINTEEYKDYLMDSAYNIGVASEVSGDGEDVAYKDETLLITIPVIGDNKDAILNSDKAVKVLGTLKDGSVKSFDATLVKDAEGKKAYVEFRADILDAATFAIAYVPKEEIKSYSVSLTVEGEGNVLPESELQSTTEKDGITTYTYKTKTYKLGVSTVYTISEVKDWVFDSASVSLGGKTEGIQATVDGNTISFNPNDDTYKTVGGAPEYTLNVKFRKTTPPIHPIDPTKVLADVKVVVKAADDEVSTAGIRDIQVSGWNTSAVTEKGDPAGKIEGEENSYMFASGDIVRIAVDCKDDYSVLSATKNGSTLDVKPGGAISFVADSASSPEEIVICLTKDSPDIIPTTYSFETGTDYEATQGETTTPENYGRALDPVSGVVNEGGIVDVSFEAKEGYHIAYILDYASDGTEFEDLSGLTPKKVAVSDGTDTESGKCTSTSNIDKYTYSYEAHKNHKVIAVYHKNAAIQNKITLNVVGTGSGTVEVGTPGLEESFTPVTDGATVWIENTSTKVFRFHPDGASNLKDVLQNGTSVKDLLTGGIELSVRGDGHDQEITVEFSKNETATEEFSVTYKINGSVTSKSEAGSITPNYSKVSKGSNPEFTICPTITESERYTLTSLKVLRADVEDTSINKDYVTKEGKFVIPNVTTDITIEVVLEKTTDPIKPDDLIVEPVKQVNLTTRTVSVDKDGKPVTEGVAALGNIEPKSGSIAKGYVDFEFSVADPKTSELKGVVAKIGGTEYPLVPLKELVSGKKYGFSLNVEADTEVVATFGPKEGDIPPGPVDEKTTIKVSNVNKEYGGVFNIGGTSLDTPEGTEVDRNLQFTIVLTPNEGCTVKYLRVKGTSANLSLKEGDGSLVLKGSKYYTFNTKDALYEFEAAFAGPVTPPTPDIPVYGDKSVTVYAKDGKTVTLETDVLADDVSKIKWQTKDGAGNWVDIPSAVGKTYVYSVPASVESDTTYNYRAVLELEGGVASQVFNITVKPASTTPGGDTPTTETKDPTEGGTYDPDNPDSGLVDPDDPDKPVSGGTEIVSPTPPGTDIDNPTSPANPKVIKNEWYLLRDGRDGEPLVTDEDTLIAKSEDKLIDVDLKKIDLSAGMYVFRSIVYYEDELGTSSVVYKNYQITVEAKTGDTPTGIPSVPGTGTENITDKEDTGGTSSNPKPGTSTDESTDKENGSLVPIDPNTGSVAKPGTADENTTYDFYVFDEALGEWIYLGQKTSEDPAWVMTDLEDGNYHFRVVSTSPAPSGIKTVQDIYVSIPEGYVPDASTKPSPGSGVNTGKDESGNTLDTGHIEADINKPDEFITVKSDVLGSTVDNTSWFVRPEGGTWSKVQDMTHPKTGKKLEAGKITTTTDGKKIVEKGDFAIDSDGTLIISASSLPEGKNQFRVLVDKATGTEKQDVVVDVIDKTPGANIPDDKKGQDLTLDTSSEDVLLIPTLPLPTTNPKDNTSWWVFDEDKGEWVEVSPTGTGKYDGIYQKEDGTLFIPDGTLEEGDHKFIVVTRDPVGKQDITLNVKPKDDVDAPTGPGTGKDDPTGDTTPSIPTPGENITTNEGDKVDALSPSVKPDGTTTDEKTENTEWWISKDEGTWAGPFKGVTLNYAELSPGKYKVRVITTKTEGTKQTKYRKDFEIEIKPKEGGSVNEDSSPLWTKTEEAKHALIDLEVTVSVSITSNTDKDTGEVKATSVPDGYVSPQGSFKVAYGTSSRFYIYPDTQTETHPAKRVKRVTVDGTDYTDKVHPYEETYTPSALDSLFSLFGVRDIDESKWYECLYFDVDNITNPKTEIFVEFESIDKDEWETMLKVYTNSFEIDTSVDTKNGHISSPSRVPVGETVKLTMYPDMSSHTLTSFKVAGTSFTPKKVHDVFPVYTYEFKATPDLASKGTRASISTIPVNVSFGEKISTSETENKVLIKATSTQGGTITPSGNIYVERGSSQTFKMTSFEGYRLSHLLVNDTTLITTSERLDENTYTYTFENIEESFSVSAVFVEDKAEEIFSISAEVEEGHGKVEPALISVNKGESATFTFVPDAGYSVKSVTVDGTKTDWSALTYTFTDIDKDHTLSVTFSPVSTTSAPTTKILRTLRSLAQTGDIQAGVMCALLTLAFASIGVAILTNNKTRKKRRG